MHFPETMTVTVTQEDIKVGNPHSGTKCPIARALARHRGRNPIVGKHTAHFSSPFDGWATYKLPQKAIDFVREFDKGSAVEPIKFRMRKDAAGVS